MNSGKSTALIQVAHNYEERGLRVLIAKPAIDVKGEDAVVSRLGVSRRVDLLIAPDDDVEAAFLRLADGRDVACVLVDEAQFLAAGQVDSLLSIVVDHDTHVVAYGIRTDFRTEAFRGSRRLLEIAHSIEELKTICRCGRKAVFNARRVAGRFVFHGEQLAIDEVGEVRYEALCAACYLAARRAAGSARAGIETDRPLRS